MYNREMQHDRQIFRLKKKQIMIPTKIINHNSGNLNKAIVSFFASRKNSATEHSVRGIF